MSQPQAEKSSRNQALFRDFSASLTVVCLAAPQCIAYAMIAGIPPVMGLYAATLPTMIAAILRSSRLTVTGPTNAISLLVLIGVTSFPMESPTTIAVTLAFMAGILQLLLYLTRLESLISFVSQPVVTGYITGAGVLIGIAQLPNITRTEADGTNILTQVLNWVEGVGAAHPPSIIIAITTIVITIGLRYWSKRIPTEMVALLVMTVTTQMLGLAERGVLLVQDLEPIPEGLPAFTLPHFGLMSEMFPLALAIAMLSLVESTSVSRAIATRIGERLSLRKEVFGQAMANISASFISGYPTSGSLARSALNESSNAASRLSALLSGVWMLLIIVLLGRWVNLIPLPALGGLLVLIARRLVRIPMLKRIWKSTYGDRWSMVGTLLGTWLLPLDQAIYLGVTIGVVSFLQRTRSLRSSSILIHDKGYTQSDKPIEACPFVHITQLEGSLYFAAAESLQEAIEQASAQSTAKTIIVRLRRTQHMDYTIASTLIIAAKNLHKTNRNLILVGLQEAEANWLQSVDTENIFHDKNLYPTQTQWFDAMRCAIQDSLSEVNCTKSTCCPLKPDLKDHFAPS